MNEMVMAAAEGEQVPDVFGAEADVGGVVEVP
jgi:hypothetical protein